LEFLKKELAAAKKEKKSPEKRDLLFRSPDQVRRVREFRGKSGRSREGRTDSKGKNSEGLYLGGRSLD